MPSQSPQHQEHRPLPGPPLVLTPEPPTESCYRKGHGQQNWNRPYTTQEGTAQTWPEKMAAQHTEGKGEGPDFLGPPKRDARYGVRLVGHPVEKSHVHIPADQEHRGHAHDGDCPTPSVHLAHPRLPPSRTDRARGGVPGAMPPPPERGDPAFCQADRAPL